MQANDYTDPPDYVPEEPALLSEQYTEYIPPIPKKSRSNGHRKQSSSNGHEKQAISKDPPRLEFVDAVDILHTVYPPRRWVIPDILPIGLTSLVAKGKIGKSLTLLEMCMNLVQPIDGKILYLDLEGDDLLLQERMRDILQGNELARDRLYFTHKAAKLSDGLFEQCKQALEEHPGTVMLVIDVYGIVQSARKEADVYHSDSTIWTELHNFAHDHNIALVVLHHTNKRQNVDDPFDLISGSTGISGSCDAQWCLLRERNKTKANLYVSGRAIVMDIMVEFELGNFSGAFKVMREDDSETVTAEQKILTIFQSGEEVLSPKIIVERTGLKPVTVRGTLRRMLYKSLLAQTTYGSYRVTELQSCNKDNVVTLVTLANKPASEANTESVTRGVTESVTNSAKNSNVVIPQSQPPSTPATEVPFTYKRPVSTPEDDIPPPPEPDDITSYYEPTRPKPVQLHKPKPDHYCYRCEDLGITGSEWEYDQLSHSWICTNFSQHTRKKAGVA